VCSEFNAFSDERIKTIKGVSDGSADLTTLNAIQVTDYTFRDTLKNGTTAQKKLIAQQVEKVFPQAVSKTTDVVPDIMKMAEIKAGWIKLTTDLKKGEKVRLLAGKDQGQVCEVLEVKKDSFRVEFETKDSEVFVYGREVNDFRTVDYDAISMLNVSATQQVKKDSDSAEAALRAENEALKAQLAAQQKRLAALEQEQSTSAARLAALEAVILKSEKNVAASQPENAPAGKARLIKF
jgi:ribosomal protein L24